MSHRTRNKRKTTKDAPATNTPYERPSLPAQADEDTPTPAPGPSIPETTTPVISNTPDHIAIVKIGHILIGQLLENFAACAKSITSDQTGQKLADTTEALNNLVLQPLLLALTSDELPMVASLPAIYHHVTPLHCLLKGFIGKLEQNFPALAIAAMPSPNLPKPNLSDQSVQTDTPPHKTYAHALVGNSTPATTPPVVTAPAPSTLGPVPNPPPQPPQPKPCARPKGPTSRPSPHAAKKPTRLIVHCKGRDLPFVTCADPMSDSLPSRYGLIASSLRSQAPSISCLGLHRNRTGNLILSFPEGTPRATLIDLAPTFRSCLSLPSEVRISFDTPWSTLHLANILACDVPDGPVHLETKLAETLLMNPALKSLTITQQPRWIRKPDSITGSRTSAVICFEDADGSIARNLLKTQIFAFGAPVTVKPWLAKPVSSRQGVPPHLSTRSDMDLS